MSRSIVGVLFLCGLSTIHGQGFFPETDQGEAGRELQYLAAWYSKHLNAMKEPSLWELSQKEATSEMYRLTLLPTFSNPIVVRAVVDAAGSITIITKTLDGKGGYDPGELVIDRTSQLSVSRAARFRKEILKHSGVWDLPMLVSHPDTITLDGTEWIVEWLKNSRYHVVIRTSPPRKDPVYSIGMFLAKDLAGLKLGKNFR